MSQTIPSSPFRADSALAALAGLGVAAAFAGQAAINMPAVALAGLSLLVTLIVLVFARRQLRADPRAGMFTRLAIGLMIATVMLALADHALLLAAAWLASGRLMAGMIGLSGERDEARAAARSASLAFTVGDLALVGATTLLMIGTGSAHLPAIAAGVPTMPPVLLVPAALLLVVAALARCALPPFSSWLMRSLAAPTPVSALMHAGFVNAGGFLLIRYAPVLEAVASARLLAFAAGVAAALAGSAIVLVRADVKGALAASTVAQMGFMLLTVALGAYAAALWHMVAHGLFKAWLFLGSAGTVSSAPAPAKALPPRAAASIAWASLVLALILWRSGHGDALLPVGLGCAALLSALAIAAPALRRGPLGLIVVAAPVALIALNAGALALISALQANATHPLIPGPTQATLLALFLAAWVTQQIVGSGRRTLPAALHARLMHAANPA